MKKLAITAIGLALGVAAFAQDAPVPAGGTPVQPAQRAELGLSAGLGDLEKTTFACPKSALNAAARAAVTYPSQGTYQFSYFKIVSSSHHAAYEVHFTSNYATEPVLKFCVTIYCQQGFDPATTASVALIGTTAPAHAGAGHSANACVPPRTTPKRPTRR